MSVKNKVSKPAFTPLQRALNKELGIAMQRLFRFSERYLQAKGKAKQRLLSKCAEYERLQPQLTMLILQEDMTCTNPNNPLS